MMGLLWLYLPFLCKHQGIGVVGLDTYTWGIKDFHKCWLGSLAKRRLCLGPAGVINCTPLSVLSFWGSLFPRKRDYNKTPGVSCHFLLQGIFLSQGPNLHILHWRVDPLPLSHLGSPVIEGRWGFSQNLDRLLSSGYLLSAIFIFYCFCKRLYFSTLLTPQNDSYSFQALAMLEIVIDTKSHSCFGQVIC